MRFPTVVNSHRFASIPLTAVRGGVLIDHRCRSFFHENPDASLEEARGYYLDAEAVDLCGPYQLCHEHREVGCECGSTKRRWEQFICDDSRFPEYNLIGSFAGWCPKLVSNYTCGERCTAVRHGKLSRNAFF